MIRGAMVGAGLACALALNALAQAPAPAPSPFEAPRGAPPVTSTSANGRLGAAPVAPRARDLAPAPKIDPTAAAVAAGRAGAPVEPVRQKKANRPARRASAAR